MNRDDVIPPSPPVKLDKLKRRSKHRNSPHKKKRSHSILSLRSKNREKSNGKENTTASTSSSGETAENKTTLNANDVDIYAGLADYSDDAKSYTKSLLKGFDILGQSKLIEQCNQYDLSQQTEVRSQITRPFSQTRGLVSLRELVLEQHTDFVNQSVNENGENLPNVRNCSVNEAIKVSIENIHFSEWPLADDLNKSLQSQRDIPNSSHLPVAVQEILNDFDDEISTPEAILRSPQPILIRKKHRKTYERKQVLPFKTLKFDDDDEKCSDASDNGRENDDDFNTQCSQDADIDLNASRRIVENLTNLSTFFTQPQSYELDFNTDLSTTHTIPDFEKRFDEFVSDSDEFEISQLHLSFCDDFGTPNQTTSQPHLTTNHTDLSNSDDDLLVNFDTPECGQRVRNVNPNATGISTPLSSSKARVEDFGMHTTPSTSKQSIPSEQRVPKRLRFGGEIDQSEGNVGFSSAIAFQPTTGKLPGFIKAGGGAISTSSTLLKRAAERFANIDDEYGPIAPIAEDPPNPKRIKFVDEVSIETPNRNCDSNRLQFDGRSDFGKNSKPSGTALSKARNLFGEDFSDLGLNKPAIRFEPAVAGPSNVNVIKNGFTTSRGGAIQISAGNLQRYGQVLNEIDRSVCEEFSMQEDLSTFNENALACKTPLTKLTHESKVFATSTPNPSSTFGFKNASLPPITPINRATHEKTEKDQSWLNEITNELDPKCLFNEDSTQQLLVKNHEPNTSMSLNDTITSDIHPINDSIVESGDNTLNVAEEVKIERRKALSEQQAECFKKPSPIRPSLGWLSVQKLLKTTKLNELGTPKKFSRSELERLGVQTSVIDLNVGNALQFKFDMWKFYPMEICRTNVDGFDLYDDIRLMMDEHSRVGVREITSAFLQCPSVDPKLIPDHWIKNALKWIIIKLGSYERSFPTQYSGRCLTPENVLAQLKYRYETEIDKVQRSAIRRIVEKDDTAAKRMILFVSRIVQHGFVYSLELSDGWYAIRTSGLDVILSKAVSNGKIAVGTKLVIQGAELEGIEEGCSPLEMPSSVVLKISANSTRRARWHAKLGYCKDTWPFPVNLNSIYGNGGVITRMRAFILRVYPLVFAVKEKTADGFRTVFRSNKVEQRQGKKDDKKQFEIVEKFYSEANEEIEKEYEKQRKKSRKTRRKLCDMDDGEELWNFMENSNDGISYETDLTPTQKKLLDDYQTKLYDEKQSKIAAIVKEKLGAFETPAKSTALQKVRLIDATSPDATKTAILSIWNMNDSSIRLRENTYLDLRNGSEWDAWKGHSTNGRQFC